MTAMLRAQPGDATSARRVERRVGLPTGRAVVGGLLMAVAALGTFLAYAGASADDRVDVLVAVAPLRAGDVIAAGDVRTVSVDIEGEVRGLFGSADAAIGRTVLVPVGAGEFLHASATTTEPDRAEPLQLTITVPSHRAVGGIRPGERVDVFSTWGSEVTELIAVDARVVDARTDGGTATVRLGLSDFRQIEALVHAQAAGDITLIRAALGTSIEDVGREYQPRTTPEPLSSSAAGPDAGPDAGPEAGDEGDR